MNNQEINEACARKLGFEFHPKECQGGKGYGRWVVCGKHWHKANHDTHSIKLPDYATSIEAAWEIVEWLSRQNVDGYHYSVSIHNMDTDPNGWYCSISHLDSPMMKDLPYEKADTATMAICLAFLKLEGSS